MFNSKRLLAFIGARADSRGFKNKNISMLAGKPLISWTIKASCESEYIDRTVVSTDGETIAQIAENSGADVPFLRPADLANDHSLIEDAVIHCVDWIERNEKDYYDYIVRLQPTSPLRNSNHIDQSLRYYFNNKKTEDDTLVSVMNVPRKLGWLMQENNSGYITFCMDVSQAQFNRQELPDYFLPNGAIYIAPVGVAKKKGFYTSNTLPFIMDDNVSIDIDSDKDLERATEVFFQQETT